MGRQLTRSYKCCIGMHSAHYVWDAHYRVDNRTHREILLNQTEIRLYLLSVWFQISQKIVNTWSDFRSIWFQFRLIRFLCVYPNNRKPRLFVPITAVRLCIIRMPKLSKLIIMRWLQYQIVCHNLTIFAP